jgi:hypothetical protein
MIEVKEINRKHFRISETQKKNIAYYPKVKEIRKYMKGKYTSEIENLRKVIKLSKELEM